MVNNMKDLIKRDLFLPKERTHKFKNIRYLFDITEKNINTIDDQTWDDLIMDEVYSKIDYTYSSQGEAVLYSMLRNPKLNVEDLECRREIIKELRKDRNTLLELRYILYDLDFDEKNYLLDMMTGKFKNSTVKLMIYLIIGILPILLIAGAIIFKQPYFLLALSFFVYIPIMIHDRENKNIKAIGLVYLQRLLCAGEKISKTKENNFSGRINEISEVMVQLNKINRNIKIIGLLNAFGGILEMLSIPFLLEEICYYSISNELEKQRSNILRLYYLVGELDGLASIAIFEEVNKDNCCIPKFSDKVSIKIKDGIHPLVNNPVANSIEINNRGIILTGTNMSGKSTFLRMVSTNIIFAQCFGFVLAKEYEGCFFNVVSSLSPKDDIVNGKSYYLAEAESILRIIKASEGDIPVFCPIDEIFRGTNPIERISSSAEILRYIQSKDKSICIVATHDKELADILKDEYEFYYFSEDVHKETGLSFDYKIKRGVSKSRNAIKLLEYIGYPSLIIHKAYERIESLENYI